VPHALAGLLDDAETVRGWEPRQRGHERLVEDARPLAASEGEERERRAVGLRGQRREAAAHGVAGDHALVAELEARLLVGAGRGPDERAEDAVREPAL